jgi:galactokinase
MDKQGLERLFQEKFSSTPRFFKAPGRINLIGEHTDYNEGFVLPAGIDKYCTIAIAPCSLEKTHVIAIDLNETCEFEKIPSQPIPSHWMNYIWGVMKAFEKRGLSIPPFEAIIQSDIPVGAGLSSSAALEVVFTKAFNELFEFSLSNMEMTRIAKEAENDFVGLQCGIMDMFASVHAKQHHAIKLDCRSLQYDYVQLQLNDNKILLIDTSVKHQLASSEYNQRRMECQSALEKMNVEGVVANSLRDISTAQIEKAKHLLSEVEYKRASYVIQENIRLEKFVDAIGHSNWQEAGQLLHASHQGLKEQYEVSCPELDFLVEVSKKIEGIWGGRLMGGGFGGCTINLVEGHKIDQITSAFSAAYLSRFGLVPKYYIASTGDGACEY